MRHVGRIQLFFAKNKTPPQRTQHIPGHAVVVEFLQVHSKVVGLRRGKPINPPISQYPASATSIHATTNGDDDRQRVRWSHAVCVCVCVGGGSMHSLPAIHAIVKHATQIPTHRVGVVLRVCTGGTAVPTGRVFDCKLRDLPPLHPGGGRVSCALGAALGAALEGREQQLSGNKPTHRQLRRSTPQTQQPRAPAAC